MAFSDEITNIGSTLDLLTNLLSELKQDECAGPRFRSDINDAEDAIGQAERELRYIEHNDTDDVDLPVLEDELDNVEGRLDIISSLLTDIEREVSGAESDLQDAKRASNLY